MSRSPFAEPPPELVEDRSVPYDGDLDEDDACSDGSEFEDGELPF